MPNPWILHFEKQVGVFVPSQTGGIWSRTMVVVPQCEHWIDGSEMNLGGSCDPVTRFLMSASRGEQFLKARLAKC
jgi:hypothetical protein